MIKKEIPDNRTWVVYSNQKAIKVVPIYSYAYKEKFICTMRLGFIRF